MRINEIITEQKLEEGPLGAIARGAGKVIGGIAKGVGAIAGIGAGAKKAFQKGKQASVDVIGGTGQGADAPAPAAAPTQAATAAPAPAAPAAAPAGGGAAQPAAQPAAPAAQPAAPAAQPATQGGAAQPAAPAAQPATQGGAQQKVEPTMQKQPAAGGANVADVIKQVDALQPAEKQQVLTAIQKAPAKEQPAADANATPKPTAQPAAQPAAQGGNFDAQTGKPTSQTGQNLEQQIQNAKQQAAQKAGRGLSPQEEKDIEAQIRGTMKPKAAPPEDDNPNLVRGTESVQRRGTIVKEHVQEFTLFKPQVMPTVLKESRKPKKPLRLYKSQ